MIFKFQNRFIIQKADADDNQRLLFLDYLSPRSAITTSVADFSLDSVEARRTALRLLIPHCIVPAPFPVRVHPESTTDTHFWQFPAITERLAFEHHAALKPPEWSLQDTTRINTYLGLPWASYIDKEWLSIPALVKQIFSVRLRGYQALAENWGLQWGHDVAVHTVCQHIHWVKLLPLWQTFGITDVHIAHCEPSSEALAAPFGIRVHAWSLAAPNIVNPDRQAGLLLGKPIAERTYLASFIGANMPEWYRSDVRLRLREEALKVACADVIFELTDVWHFNPMVYQAQVIGEPLTPEQITAERAATVRYNALLSDSVFSLCPEGSGPNTLRLWESLAVGAIPVVIVEDWIPPTVPGTGLAWEDAVIWVRRDEVSGLFDRLRTLRDTEPQRLEAMQTAGMALYQRFAECLCF